MSYSDTNLVNGDDKQGESFRFLYSKSLNDWGTEFRIAGYRYSTSGYYDFSDAVAERERYENGYYRNDYYDQNDRNLGVPDWAESRRRSYYTSRFNNKRQRVELSVNQRIAGNSTLYANLSNQSYWGGLAKIAPFRPVSTAAIKISAMASSIRTAAATTAIKIAAST